MRKWELRDIELRDHLGFQGGFRNADGSLRKEKVQISIDEIPRNFIIT